MTCKKGLDTEFDGLIRSISGALGLVFPWLLASPLDLR